MKTSNKINRKANEKFIHRDIKINQLKRFKLN